MPLREVVLGVSAVIEIIRFVQTHKAVKDMTPEQVLAAWAANREAVDDAERQALAAIARAEAREP